MDTDTHPRRPWEDEGRDQAMLLQPSPPAKHQRPGERHGTEPLRALRRKHPAYTLISWTSGL